VRGLISKWNKTDSDDEVGQVQQSWAYHSVFAEALFSHYAQIVVCFKGAKRKAEQFPSFVIQMVGTDPSMHMLKGSILEGTAP